MLSKREAAEKNIDKAQRTIPCNEECCPLYKECSAHLLFGDDLYDNIGKCMSFCRQWLKDNPKIQDDDSRVAEQEERIKEALLLNSCHWEGESFHGCRSARKKYDEVNSLEDIISDGDKETFKAASFSFCPYCGADIRKPKPTLTIIPSGGTFVAEKDGIDYILNNMIMARSCHDTGYNNNLFEDHLEDGLWVKIEGLQITDNIALLRPMVRIGRDIETLIAVFSDTAFILNDSIGLDGVRLATVSDLVKK